MNDVIDFIYANRDRYIAELTQYLAIPSISAMPEHKGDVLRCAQYSAAEMTRIGLENVRVVETPGHPLVYGDWLHADGAPTILLYGHYDVQPVDPIEQWVSPPFEPTIRDGQIYARGASDDKGQVFVHLKAIEAHMQKTGRLPVNMKVILEGEEEVGSENLGPYIRDNAQALAADMVLISDTRDVRPGRAVHLLRTSRPDLHADRPARLEERPPLRPVRRRGGQPGQRDGATSSPS